MCVELRYTYPKKRRRRCWVRGSQSTTTSFGQGCTHTSRLPWEWDKERQANARGVRTTATHITGFCFPGPGTCQMQSLPLVQAVVKGNSSCFTTNKSSARPGIRQAHQYTWMSHLPSHMQPFLLDLTSVSSRYRADDGFLTPTRPREENAPQMFQRCAEERERCHVGLRRGRRNPSREGPLRRAACRGNMYWSENTRPHHRLCTIYIVASRL